MRCVGCKEPMIVLEIDQIEIDHCLACGGVWRDAGELEALLEDREGAEGILLRPMQEGESQRSGRKCPICRRRMRLSAPIGDSGVKIDFCSRRHGIWFDRGELEEVVRFLDNGHEGPIVLLLRNMFGRKA